MWNRVSNVQSCFRRRATFVSSVLPHHHRVDRKSFRSNLPPVVADLPENAPPATRQCQHASPAAPLRPITANQGRHLAPSTVASIVLPHWLHVFFLAFPTETERKKRRALHPSLNLLTCPCVALTLHSTLVSILDKHPSNK